MVDTEGVEILAHLAHARFPPGEIVFRHFFPVVGRETPVLAEGGESIRRCARLGIQVVEGGIGPRIHAGAADADWQVSFQGHAVGMGIGHRVFELDVEVELDEAVEVDFFLMGSGIVGHFLGAVFGHLAPLAEVRRAGLIPQAAEDRIRQQPAFVGLIEGLVFLRFKHLRLGEGFAEQAEFLAVNPLIINLRKGIQLVPQGLVGLVLADAGIRQVDELRVQGEGRVSIVRIGILPGAGHGGIIDRQELDHVLARCDGPVHQQADVVEFADAETLLAAQGEDRDGRAGSPPGKGREDGNDIAYQQMATFGRYFIEEAVRAGFPADRSQGLAVHQGEFIIKRLVHLQGQGPDREGRIVHQLHLLPAPVAAGQGDGQVGADFSGREDKGNVAFLRLRRPFAAGENHILEQRGPERGVGRPVLPAVFQDQFLHARRRVDMVGNFFRADAFLAPPDLIMVFTQGTDLVQGQGPDAALSRSHVMPFAACNQHKAVAPTGLVFNEKLDLHGSYVLCYRTNVAKKTYSSTTFFFRCFQPQTGSRIDTRQAASQNRETGTKL